MFSKILVANRGEIAVRAFRAAYELGAKTVAVFPYEDRNSTHRQKADEAYQIGEKGHPVSAYLNVAEIIRVAKACGADAIYPGYGFLSENPELAKAAAENGISFIGPSSEVLELAGNKVNAIAAATKAGVPVLHSTGSSEDPKQLIKAAEKIGFPLFVKASGPRFGFGGAVGISCPNPGIGIPQASPEPTTTPKAATTISRANLEQNCLLELPCVICAPSQAINENLRFCASHSSLSHVPPRSALQDTR
jgi:pyruvate carboxylase